MNLLLLPELQIPDRRLGEFARLFTHEQKQLRVIEISSLANAYAILTSL